MPVFLQISISNDLKVVEIFKNYQFALPVQKSCVLWPLNAKLTKSSKKINPFSNIRKITNIFIGDTKIQNTKNCRMLSSFL